MRNFHVTHKDSQFIPFLDFYFQESLKASVNTLFHLFFKPNLALNYVLKGDTDLLPGILVNYPVMYWLISLYKFKIIIFIKKPQKYDQTYHVTRAIL